MPRTQDSRRAQRDEYIARMMRKQNRARLTADVALLLSSGMRLLVRHDLDRQGQPTRAIAFARFARHTGAVSGGRHRRR